MRFNEIRTVEEAAQFFSDYQKKATKKLMREEAHAVASYVQYQLFNQENNFAVPLESNIFPEDLLIPDTKLKNIKTDYNPHPQDLMKLWTIGIPDMACLVYFKDDIPYVKLRDIIPYMFLDHFEEQTVNHFISIYQQYPELEIPFTIPIRNEDFQKHAAKPPISFNGKPLHELYPGQPVPFMGPDKVTYACLMQVRNAFTPAELDKAVEDEEMTATQVVDEILAYNRYLIDVARAIEIFDNDKSEIVLETKYPGVKKVFHINHDGTTPTIGDMLYMLKNNGVNTILF